MPRKAKLSSSELQAIVSRQIAQAESNTDIADERADLFDAYMAEPYGDEVVNRSQVVSTDVSDTVEWIMPELMEIFTGGDKVVSFEPVGPDDEELAEQETDVVNHVFMRQNDGFLILYSFLKDGLIQKNGYVKRWWDQTEKTTTEEYKGLTPEDLMGLEKSWGDAAIEYVSGDMDDEGINIEVKITEKSEQMRIAPVPPEELLIAPRWNSISLVGCPFVAHKKLETVSSLIEMGFDRQQCEELGDAADDEFGEERIARFGQRGTSEDADAEPADRSMSEVMTYECYVYLDMDGDGIAELRKVMCAGTGHTILKRDGEDANDEVNSNPFSAWSPVIVPHRHFGRAIADLVVDLQRIQTMLLRNTLDNFYHMNNPTREIAEDGIGENTIEDLLVDRPGKIVRTLMPGMYVEHVPPPFAAEALAMIEHINTVRENRTGVSRLSQGLDANTINKTARGQAQLMTAAQKKIALIARIAAETGVKDLFKGIHDDLRRNASKALTLRLRNEWVAVDPRHWRSRADVAANVALGVGNADQQMQKLMVIAEKQEQNLLAGSPIVTPSNLHHTYTKMIDVAGFKNPDAFFTDPATVEPTPPPPDPQVLMIEAQKEIEALKAQGRAQEAAMKDAQETKKAQLETAKAVNDAETAREEAKEKSRELDKKIELMDAQIAKLYAEMQAQRAEITLKAHGADREHDRNERDFQLNARKTDAEIGARDKELQITKEKTDGDLARSKRDAETGRAEEKKTKAKRTVTHLIKHDEEGRIASIQQEENE